MKKFAKLTFMWIWSFILALGFVYWAGTLIKNLSQTATKWDIVTSDWINAVNIKANNLEDRLKNLENAWTWVGWTSWQCVLLDSSNPNNYTRKQIGISMVNVAKCPVWYSYIWDTWTLVKNYSPNWDWRSGWDTTRGVGESSKFLFICCK